MRLIQFDMYIVISIQVFLESIQVFLESIQVFLEKYDVSFFIPLVFRLFKGFDAAGFALA